MTKERNTHRKRNSIGKLILGVFFLLFVLFFVILIGEIQKTAEETFGKPVDTLSATERIIYPVRLLLNEEALTTPAQAAGNKVDFHIDSGESATEVASSLRSGGLISDASAFILYLEYSGLDTKLKAGDFSLDTGQTAIEVANALCVAISKTVTFRILAGWRAEEVAGELPTSGLSITSADFIQAVDHPSADLLALLPSSDSQTLEGYLFPDSYQFDRTISLDQMLVTMLNDFNAKLTTDIRQGFSNQGLSLAQGVILASIVQKEAIVQDEQATIASVFLNRIRLGMKLESDPTVQYALGYNSTQSTWWTNPLSSADLTVDSPYNTYVYGGFPPAPISNPSLSALQAVAFPASTDYFYFRAACDSSGRHNFAKTLAEQVQNACP